MNLYSFLHIGFIYFLINLILIIVGNRFDKWVWVSFPYCISRTSWTIFSNKTLVSSVSAEPLPPFKENIWLLWNAHLKYLRDFSSCSPKFFSQFILPWEYVTLSIMCHTSSEHEHGLWESKSDHLHNSLSCFSPGLAFPVPQLRAQILCSAAGTYSTQLPVSYLTLILALTSHFSPLFDLLAHPYLHNMEPVCSVRSSGAKYIKEWVPQGLELELSQSP